MKTRRTTARFYAALSSAPTADAAARDLDGANSESPELREQALAEQRRIVEEKQARAAFLAQLKAGAATKGGPSAWQRRRLKSEMDDSTGVVYTLAAANMITGWLKTYRPTLFIRCQE